ncbi:RNA-guided endonuclease TnpB family protein [Streptomyces kanasensis]|uniref:RNA-guided endonuclease TnpB family protein n=1 Tax=Streptomyces kanasensis TaxID=936756 RepID=UPI0037021758
MPVETITRAYRFTLDTSPHHTAVLERNAGAARWAFNHAHRMLLAQHAAYDQRKQAAAEHLAGMTRDEITARLPKPERKKLYARARQVVSAENKVLVAELQVWDDHRKRVVHKGKPALDPGDDPGEDGTDLQRQLYARRLHLARLQQADPAAYTAERKRELEAVRPAILESKQHLAARGAYRPGSFDIASIWRTTRDLPREEGGCPWWTEVAVGSITCGFDRADTAWRNWMASAAGKRAGSRMGVPRFRKKGKARDSFYLANAARSVVHLDDYRHLRIIGLGTFRLHESAKRLVRLLRKGLAEITSVTITRSGHRWHASVLTQVQQEIPDRPTARQRAAGLLAIDLGSAPLAYLSAPLDPADPDSRAIQAPKPLHVELSRLTRAQQALARTQKGSKRRRKAARRVGRIHALVAARRAGHLHGVSKRLATGAAQLAIEDLDLTALTASAKGTVEEPGTHVKVKSMFSRHLLDAGLGELRRQLTYKTRWYGSTLVILDRGEATATKCSRCGERNPSSSPSRQRFTCPHCGLDVGRRDNAVRNIYKAARRAVTTSVACGERDTQNALRDGDHPTAGDGGGPLSLKRPPP